MTTTRRFFLIALALLFAGTVEAQTLAVRTTLAANVAGDTPGPADRVIQVTSNTGFTVGNFVWIDFEQMRITAINGTAISVVRGVNGTRTAAHDNTDGVITGTGAGGIDGSGHFHTRDPDTGGDCTRGSGEAAFLPWINVVSGWMWTCDNGITADWSGTLKSHQTVASEPTSF